MDPTSFMSEHTAEYVLVNDLVHRLSPAFPDLLPMFFWATREGNRTAIESMRNLNFRLLTCFARRPKVAQFVNEHILMKVNPELKQYYQACRPLGIPVVAGLPMIRSLSSLRLTSVCNWFLSRILTVSIRMNSTLWWHRTAPQLCLNRMTNSRFR